MSNVNFHKQVIFRETPDVIFSDITVSDSNATDLVIHDGPAISPPDDSVGAKQFYIHKHQIDHNRVVHGTRIFEIVNPEWKNPYHIVHLNRSTGALIIPVGTWHRSTSGEHGSVVINHAIRDDEFDHTTEFIPTSAANCPELYKILTEIKPVLHTV